MLTITRSTFSTGLAPNGKKQCAIFTLAVGGNDRARPQKIEQEGQERISRLATRNGRALWSGRWHGDQAHGRHRAGRGRRGNRPSSRDGTLVLGGNREQAGIESDRDPASPFLSSLNGMNIRRASSNQDLICIVITILVHVWREKSITSIVTRSMYTYRERGVRPVPRYREDRGLCWLREPNNWNNLLKQR